MEDATWATLDADLLVNIAAKSGSARALPPMLLVNQHWQAALGAGGDVLWKELALARFPRLQSLVALVPSTLPFKTLYRKQLAAHPPHPPVVHPRRLVDPLLVLHPGFLDGARELQSLRGVEVTSAFSRSTGT